MLRLHCLGLLLLLTVGSPTSAEQPQPVKIIDGLSLPESAAIGPDGRTYVSIMGERDVMGDGSIVVLVDGKAKVFASGLDDPKGLTSWKDDLYVADRTRIWRISKDGKPTVFAAADAFPIAPMFFNDLTVDDQGTFYVADSGNRQGQGGAVFKISPDGKPTKIVTAAERPEIKMPNGVLSDGPNHVLMADFLAGILYRVRLSDGALENIADDLGAADGIVRDDKGNLYVSDWKGGRVFRLPGGNGKPVLIATGFQAAADICLGADGKHLIVPDLKAGTISLLPIQ
jgi:sugar lactone lactonase YvrE